MTTSTFYCPRCGRRNVCDYESEDECFACGWPEPIDPGQTRTATGEILISVNYSAEIQANGDIAETTFTLKHNGCSHNPHLGGWQGLEKWLTECMADQLDEIVKSEQPKVNDEKAA